jgi:hypothetical protein
MTTDQPLDSLPDARRRFVVDGDHGDGPDSHSS